MQSMQSELVDLPANEASCEQVARAILCLVGENPGISGSIRTARIVGGFSVSFRSNSEMETLTKYSVGSGLKLAEIIKIIDALKNGGLITNTCGARPTLVLTRAGFRALEALEQQTPI